VSRLQTSYNPCRKQTSVASPASQVALTHSDCRLGSQSRGYHPVAPRPIAAGPLCSAIWFRPSSPVAFHVMRHDRPLLVIDGITGEKWPVNLACDSDFHFTSPPKEGMLRIFSPEKSEGFGRDRTRDLGYQRPA
jgi:hypothetical protein